MKRSFALAFALVLSGCSDIDLFGYETTTPAPVAEQPLPPPAAQPVNTAPAADQPAAPAADQSAAPEVQAPAAAAEPVTIAAAAPVATAPAAPVAPEAGEPPAVAAARAAPAPDAATDAHCKNLAKLRAGDAAFQGEDPDTQRAVHDKTYSDCLAWDSQHRS